MTILQQDTILINDIIKRNYYSYFKRGEKSLCLTFFYNDLYNNSRYIPGFETPVSNIENIKSNLKMLIDWYKENNFTCPIILNDDFFLYDEDLVNYTFNALLDLGGMLPEIKVNTPIGPFLKQNILTKLIHFTQKFQQADIVLHFNITTNLIDINRIECLQDLTTFINDMPNNILKININPNNLAFFMKSWKTIFSMFDNTKIYLYEEGNYGWTEYKNDEYLQFLNEYSDYLLNKYPTINELFHYLFCDQSNGLFNLSDKGVIDNTCNKGQCSFYSSLCLLLEDLSINLCPKFQFDDQVIGYYQIKQGKIDEIYPHTLALVSMPAHLKRTSTPHCEHCMYVGLCRGCCCKHSYDVCLNPIIPVREYCNMTKVKFNFLFYKLIKLKIFTPENLTQCSYLTDKYKDYIISLIELLKERLNINDINE